MNRMRSTVLRSLHAAQVQLSRVEQGEKRRGRRFYGSHESIFTARQRDRL